MKQQLLIISLTFFISCTLVQCKKEKEKPDWAKKDITDFSDADMERLLDQWEEDEDPLEPDELPEHLRPPVPLDMSQLQDDPQKFLKLSKKGKTLMAFVSVHKGTPRDKTETITKLWQGSLWNNHIQAERYLIADDRAIFLFKDGEQAFEAKDFLIEQEDCDEVVIDNMPYPGKFKKGSQLNDDGEMDEENYENERDEL